MIGLLALAAAVGVLIYGFTRKTGNPYHRNFVGSTMAMLTVEEQGDHAAFIRHGHDALASLPQDATANMSPPAMYQAAMIRPEEYGPKGLIQLAIALEVKGYYYEAANAINVAMRIA